LKPSLDILLGRLAQADFLFVLRHALAFARTDFFAFQRDRFHTLAERIGEHQRHRDGQDRRDRGDAGQQHRQRLRVERVFQKREHWTYILSEVE
jgi:hypothetical protein